METNNAQSIPNYTDKYYVYDVVDMPPRSRWTGNYAGGYDIRRPMPVKVPRAPNRRRLAPDSDDEDDDKESKQQEKTARKQIPSINPRKDVENNKAQTKVAVRKPNIKSHQPKKVPLVKQPQPAQTTRKHDVTAQKKDYVLGPPGLPEEEIASSPYRAGKPKHSGNAGTRQAGTTGRTARRGRYWGRKQHRQLGNQSSFLNKLPGEIRNQIYEYLVPQTRVLVCVSKPEKEHMELQKSWQYEGSKIRLARSRLYCLIDSNQLEAGFEISSGLLLACKQIKDEVNEFLYSRTVFCFDSMNVVHKFLDTTSKKGIESIQNLEICHEGYGEPKMTKDIVYKERYDLKWQKTCERIGNEMLSLKSVKLQVQLTDWPMVLCKEERWHKALMTIVAHRQLHLVKLHLKHHMFTDQKMIRASHKMENLMMSEAGKAERDLKETLAVLRRVKAQKDAEMARRAKLPPVQASKCLKIRVGDHAIAPKEPVRTTKTYTQSVACWEWKYGTGNILGENPYVCKA